MDFGRARKRRHRLQVLSVPTEAELRDIVQHIRWALLQAPTGRKMAVLREELGRLSEEIKPIVEDLVLLGAEAMSDEQTAPKWMAIAGVIFAGITMISLLVMLFAPQDVAASRHTIFNVWISICTASSLSFFGGNAHASGRIPFFKDSPVEFIVVGGIAVFVITLILMFHFNP